MHILYWILIFLGTFSVMEFNAWFTHKYIMHGFLWSLHKDHHKKDHTSWFERNDAFFIFYAVLSMTLFYLWSYEDLWYCLPLALGILAYGIAYFTVHDIFSTSVLKSSETSITDMPKACDVPIKCITNIWEKNMANVLEC